MNDNRNFQPNNDNGEKSKAKSFWKHAGLVALAICLATLTVFIINLNR